MAGIKHAKVSAKVDDPDTTEVNPSDWNADHTITGDVPFNAHKATGLADPTLAQDAATKAYVDGHSGGVGPGTPAAVARFVTSTTLGNSSILDNGAGTTEFIGSVIFDGNVSLSGGGLTVDMGGNLVHNMVDPAAAQDAATKAYVDSKVGNLIGSGLTVGRSAYTSSGSTLSAGSFVDNGTNASIAGALTIGGSFIMGSARKLAVSSLASNVAVANTETVVKSLVIPANSMSAGAVLQFYAIATNAGAGGNATVFKLRFGPTTLTGTALITHTITDTSQVAKEWSGGITFRTVGASAGVVGHSLLRTPDGGGYDLTNRVGVTAPVTVDTTVANLLEITFISGNAASTYTFYESFLNQVF